MSMPEAKPLDAFIPYDRIVGAGLPLFEHTQYMARIDNAILDHVTRNKSRLIGPPRWHHWRIGRLAINWRWCKA